MAGRYSFGEVLSNAFGSGRKAVMGDTEVGYDSAKAAGMPEAERARPDIFKMLLG